MSDAATRGFVRGTERDRGFERVAMFLLQIGMAEAARVLPHLDEGEVIGIVREIARTGRIETREAARIMEEFGYGRSAVAADTRGGIAAAGRLLRTAFTRQRADALLATALRHDETGTARSPLPPTNDNGGAVE